MFGWRKKKGPGDTGKSREALRTVPGAGVYRDRSGQVMYNLLDPWMQQFLGRCVGALKKAGIRAKGTGSFSVQLGDGQGAELQLDPFWSEFCQAQDPNIIARVVEAAQKAIARGSPNG
jgi:hypothetical protein